MLEKMSTQHSQPTSESLREQLIGLRSSVQREWMEAELKIGIIKPYLSAVLRYTQEWTLWKGVDGHIRLGIGLKSRHVFSDWNGAIRHLKNRSNRPPVTFFGGRFDRTRTHTQSPWFSWPAIETYTPLVVLEWQNVDDEMGRIHLPNDAFDAALNTLTTLSTWTPAHIENDVPSVWEPVESQAEWHTRMARLQNNFSNSALEKVVMARHVSSRGPLTPSALENALSALLRDSAQETVFAIARDESIFIGCSPETLANLRDGVLQTHALAGTSVSAEDRETLRHDETLLREHQAVVRHLEARLRPICSNLRIDETQLRSSRALTHLETQMRANVAGLHLIDLVASLHPTPALGGAPAEAATAWLREHERLDRGWFGGPIGWFSETGDGQCAVAIRCMLHTSKAAYAYAGAGIVSGSNPEKEWRETEAKLHSMLRYFSEPNP